MKKKKKTKAPRQDRPKVFPIYASVIAPDGGLMTVVEYMTEEEYRKQYLSEEDGD